MTWLRRLSFRSKLAATYSVCLALTLGALGLGARYAMQRNLQDAVDKELKTRLRDVQAFVREESASGESRLLTDLREQALLGLGGGMMELWDEHMAVFRTRRVEPGTLGPPLTEAAGTLRFAYVLWKNHRYRVAWRVEPVGDKQYGIRVGQDMDEFDEALQGFDRLLAWTIPLLLAAVAGAGHYLSGRALRPVAQMTEDARAIRMTNLSARIVEPPGDDEIQRLAVTLNEMLGRLETEVRRVVQFTEDASHELRSPLALIHSAAEFGLRPRGTDEERVAALRKILAESARTANLLSDLLTLARNEASPREHVELSDLLLGIRDQYKVAAAAKSIDLHVATPQDELLVAAEPSGLGRMISILIDNAVKYTPDGGVVSVTAERADDSAVVTVSDTGIGISAKDLPEIWNRFWRADRVRTRNVGGFGLGLAIAREIAARHDAVLTADSQPGRGSRFQLRMAAVSEERTLKQP